MNLSANATEDHSHSYQKEDRNRNGSRSERKHQPMFIKGIITETEMDPSISEYDRDEQQDQNCLSQYSTEY